MNKRRILLIGCGKAGNKLVNEMLKKDSRLTGLFVNTAYNDMAGLEKFKEDSAFLFPSADGSGRNREKALGYVKDNLLSLVDLIVSYPLHDVIYIFTSADGGTGSGMTPMLARLLRMTFDKKKLDKKINLVGIMPSIKEDDKVGVENALSFWNELVVEEKGKPSIIDSCLDNIYFIDNSKGNTYKEINEKAVNNLVNSFNMNGQHDEGDIDDTDARTFNTEKGFGLILDLDNKYRDAKSAINSAIKESVFAIPDNYDCNYMGISLNEDDFLISDVRNSFDKVYKGTYKTYNKRKTNTVVLTGCNAPSEIIENLKNKLDEIKLSEESREVKKVDLGVDLGQVTNSKKENKNESVNFTEDELNNIANELESLFE